MSKAELDNIIEFGGFRQQPGGFSYEGKLFALSVEEATNFGHINYHLDMVIGLDKPFHIVESDIPDFFAQQFEPQILDLMSAIYVPEELLPLFNRHARVRELQAIPLQR